MVFRHAMLEGHIQLTISLVHAEFTDGEITPTTRFAGEIAHPWHDTMEVDIIGTTTSRLVQTHHIVEVAETAIHPVSSHQLKIRL